MELTLSQGIRRAWTMICVGSVLMFVATAALLLGLVKAIYALAYHYEGKSFDVLARNVVVWVQMLYAEAAQHAPQIVGWLWDSLTPDIDLAASPLDGRQWQLWMSYFVLFVGVALVSRGCALRSEVLHRRKRAHEIAFEESARRRARGESVERFDALNMEREVRFSEPRPKWHTTWWGVLLLMAAGGLMTDALKVVIGLAKLP
jgi:hypothetical protein